MKLYEIDRELRLQMAAIANEDITAQEAADRLRGLQGSFEDKLSAVVGYALELQKLAATRIEESKRMAASAKPLQTKAESLLDYAQISIQNVDMPLPMRLKWFTLNLAKMPPKSDVFDEVIVPSEYKTSTVILTLQPGIDPSKFITEFSATKLLDQTVDIESETAVSKSAILADLKEGVIISGAKLEPLAYRLTVK